MGTQPVRVAIDLETTGLHPEQDAIIEIGALKFAGDDVLETFESFVSTGAQLPYRIQRLTNITPKQLASAPPLSELLPRLREFLGDAPLVGHSVQFDAAFLRRVGLARRNPLVDTYELASALLPNLSSYTLASVGAALDVHSPVYHRALADALLARDVFLALLKRLDRLDGATLESLGRLATPPDWTPSYFVRAAVRAQRGAYTGASTGAFGATGGAFGTLGDQLAAKLGMNPAVLSLAITPESATPPAQPLRAVLAQAPAHDDATPPPTHADAVDAADAAQPSALSPMPVAEERYPQAHAADRAAQAQRAELLSTWAHDGGAALFDAPDDTITLSAALAPVLHWAAARDKRVLISLADSAAAIRMTQRTLPQALARAGLAADTLTIAEVFEHDAYICLHRWFGDARSARDGVLPRDVARGLAKLTVWSGATQTGARAEVALNGPEMTAWERARSGPEFADSSPTCSYRRDGYCFVTRAKAAAAQAAVIVTTHQALAMQLAGADAMLPQVDRVIALDARQLEDELRRAQSVALDQQELLAKLMALAEVAPGGERAGLLHMAAERLQRPGTPSREGPWFAQVERARTSVERFFQALRGVLRESLGEPADGSPPADAPEQRALRLDENARQLRSWSEAQHAWAPLNERFSALAKTLREAAQLLVAARGGKATVAHDGVATDLLGFARQLDHICDEGARFFRGDSTATTPTAEWLRMPYTIPNAPVSAISEFQLSGQSQQGRHSPAPAANNHIHSPQQPATPRSATQHAPNGKFSPVAASADADTGLTLHRAPVAVGSLLTPLYTKGAGLALMGTALAVSGDFSYHRGALGLPEGIPAYGPTLERTEQTLLCLPTDAPEPNAPAYQRRLDDALIQLATALDGRLVALFPSHGALRASAFGIRQALERRNIMVLAQGQDGSARQLWQTFRTERRVVLLGAGAFWDGDEQPDTPEGPPACVVVTRIPFPALSDPLLAARAEQWPDRQQQFVVPHAALKLRQALTGLAWSHWRRNAVVLFDKRLQTREYGPTLISALARCERCDDTTAQIVERITEWTMRSTTRLS